MRIEVASPVVGSELSLEGDPVRVSFRGRYEDLVRVLGDLESRRIPARLEALEVRRAHPEVAAQLTLTAFAQREARS